MRYTCWQSHTCWVCSGGTGKPIYHVSSRGYRATSPCDTVPRLVQADTRTAALRAFKAAVPTGHGAKEDADVS